MIFFLTRSFAPYQNTGGGKIRKSQVDEFQRLGWPCMVIMPNYEDNELKVMDNVIQIPFYFRSKWLEKIYCQLERFGVLEDYLDCWVKKAFAYLKDKIKKDDIIFSTCGGELGMIKLGSLLKEHCSCKFIVNYHDPLMYGLVNELKINNSFHVAREQCEMKYLINCDAIITSSKLNEASLKSKYPNLKDKIRTSYFGYIRNTTQTHVKSKSDKLKIAYAGNMAVEQKPEILYEAFNLLRNKSKVEIYFIGDASNYKPIKNIHEENVKVIKYLPHDEFLMFMSENIDVAFVSLSNDYLGACVPSKIFEYINLCIPMIGALPFGDGENIINSNQYGISCKYDDYSGIAEAIEKYLSPDYLEIVKANLVRDKEKWSMSYRTKEIDCLLHDV